MRPRISDLMLNLYLMKDQSLERKVESPFTFKFRQLFSYTQLQTLDKVPTVTIQILDQALSKSDE